ncbi:hypothetical protein F907_02543 [Acinetobacter colistiniresistens]|uniref:Uncharacterized protein n=1 Tax=Acinetobacter colistiniresistens TaxID=280145 RepID=S3T5P3_9GAMM|nr:hypothetical protein F907_02543 [Acinetobacter colistiniresistens]
MTRYDDVHNKKTGLAMHNGVNSFPKLTDLYPICSDPMYTSDKMVEMGLFYSYMNVLDWPKWFKFVFLKSVI